MKTYLLHRKNIDKIKYLPHGLILYNESSNLSLLNNRNYTKLVEIFNNEKSRNLIIRDLKYIELNKFISTFLDNLVISLKLKS